MMITIRNTEEIALTSQIWDIMVQKIKQVILPQEEDLKAVNKRVRKLNNPRNYETMQIGMRTMSQPKQITLDPLIIA